MSEKYDTIEEVAASLNISVEEAARLMPDFANDEMDIGLAKHRYGLLLGRILVADKDPNQFLNPFPFPFDINAKGFDYLKRLADFPLESEEDKKRADERLLKTMIRAWGGTAPA